jgi:hypothetical protein
MRSGIALSVVGGMIFAFANGPTAARDFNSLLEGEYMFTGSSTCINSFNGFDANFAPNPGGTFAPFAQSLNITGIRTFNGDGTGSASGTNISIRLPNQFGGGGANASEVSGTFTYEVQPDLTLTITSGPVSGTNTSGSGAGQTFTVTGVPLFEGRISEDLQKITIAHVTPGVETITPQVGNARQRVCYRERTLIKIKRGAS